MRRRRSTSDTPGAAVVEAPTIRWRQATVIATHTGSTPKTVDIRIGGSSTTVSGVRYMSSYAPVVADVVWVLLNGSDPIVLGRLA